MTRLSSSCCQLLPLQTELGQKLSLCSKLCFAIGGAPKEVAASATAFFLQIYLLDIAQVASQRNIIFLSSKCFQHFKLYLFLFLCVFSFPLQINAVQASMVLFVGKAWGAVTDPIVGFFITKSRWTKIGRLMPWWDCYKHIYVPQFCQFYMFFFFTRPKCCLWTVTLDPRITIKDLKTGISNKNVAQTPKIAINLRISLSPDCLNLFCLLQKFCLLTQSSEGRQFVDRLRNLFRFCSHSPRQT